MKKKYLSRCRWKKTLQPQSLPLSDSGIMAILLLFHSGAYRKFKHHYIHCICGHIGYDFPGAVSCDRLAEPEHRMLFQLFASGRCTGINFVDSAMMPICYNPTEQEKQFCGSANTTRRLSESIFTPQNSIISNADYRKFHAKNKFFPHWFFLSAAQDFQINAAGLRNLCTVPIFRDTDKKGSPQQARTLLCPSPGQFQILCRQDKAEISGLYFLLSG